MNRRGFFASIVGLLTAPPPPVLACNPLSVDSDGWVPAFGKKVPEIDIKITTSYITVAPRKLKYTWSCEPCPDDHD